MSIVFVHIGLPKTGTTHLQDRLWRNRDLALRSARLLYPGNGISDHFHAAVHLQPERYLDWADPAFARAWPTMVAQIRAWPHRSLVSHELFSTATPAHIDSLLSDLSFADEVHVIATVRDLARQLPSVWQENVKNQRQATFDEFVESVRLHARPLPGSMDAATSSPDRSVEHLEEEPFWEFQDHVTILGRWAKAVGSERVHVVTVPRGTPAAGDGLWERFLRVVGADPADLTAQVPSTNSSLSAAQAEFLRRLNARLQPADVEWRRYERVVKARLIGEVLFGRSGGAPLGLSAAQRQWAGAQAEAMIDAVHQAGYAIVGGRDDLTVATTAQPDATPPTEPEVLDVALDALADLVKTAPLPRVTPQWQTRAKNLARRAQRRAIGLRRRES